MMLLSNSHEGKILEIGFVSFKYHTCVIAEQELGKPPSTKTDDFWKSSKRPLNPPPSFSEKYIADFWGPVEVCARQIYPQYEGTFAIYIFGLEITPPPPWNFSENSSVLVGPGVP